MRVRQECGGRKSDVQDCQWIQRLHTYGLLQDLSAEDPYCILRTSLRYRDELVSARSTQLSAYAEGAPTNERTVTQVLSDVTGVSGMAIIEAILAGERDPVKLAK